VTEAPLLSPVDGSDEAQDDRLALWWAPVDVPASTLQSLAGCLSSAEQRRGEGYNRPLDRDRFLAARGWLRRLLASLLLCHPGAVEMVTAANGKPELVDSDVRFNASRSGGIALYATSRVTEVGVDIEKIRPTADVEGIAARFFSPAERRALASLPAASRREATFHCWTRKEAYVKGLATGLTVPISNIDVGVDSSRPVTVAGWRVHQVDVSPGFAAAVAAERYDGTAPNVQRIVGLL
jgi:4'-phosphopantetheinyl transferase